jgi:hypothetical protein
VDLLSSKDHEVARVREAWHDEQMETPKPPASSSLRRPSTRPYARRRPNGDRDGAAALDGAATAAASAASAEAAVAAATADIEAPAKKPKSRARSKTKPEPSALRFEAPALEPVTAAHEAAALDTELPAMSAALGALESALASAAEPPAAAIAPAEIPALTALPSPRQLPTGAPTDPAPPPGLVPRGDSRSLRRGELFALVYRVHSFVVTRHGHAGQLGHWSAVEYPTPAAASHAYARGCSHWVSEGFSDYRG